MVLGNDWNRLIRISITEIVAIITASVHPTVSSLFDKILFYNEFYNIYNASNCA